MNERKISSFPLLKRNRNSEDRLKLSLRDRLKSLGLKAQLFYIRLFDRRRLNRQAQEPGKFQLQLLQRILKKNRRTWFGRSHNFAKINDYENYQKEVPLNTYQTLENYLNKQENIRNKYLCSYQPLSYIRSSGATGAPKLLPVNRVSRRGIRKSFTLQADIISQQLPDAFRGQVLNISGSTASGQLFWGTKMHCESRSSYQFVPYFMRKKFMIPSEVFNIADSELKFDLIIKLALCRKNITMLQAPDPETLILIWQRFIANKSELINEILTNDLSTLSQLAPGVRKKVAVLLEARERSNEELEEIKNYPFDLCWNDLWPHLKTVVTRLHGCHRLTADTLRRNLKSEIPLIDSGYHTSEFRGTITVDTINQSGLFLPDSNFYEFVAKDDFDSEEMNFLLLNDLKVGEEYYLFVTTQTGLYRYHQNDLLQVTGRYCSLPLFRFVQRGEGIVELAGEKLYESQLVDAVQELSRRYKLPVIFMQGVGSQRRQGYEVYVELSDCGSAPPPGLALELDQILCEKNKEYNFARNCGQLKRLRLTFLQPGTLEEYIRLQSESGQIETPFQTVALRSAEDVVFPFNEYRLADTVRVATTV